MIKKKPEHCVMVGRSNIMRLRCTHCGEKYDAPLPLTMLMAAGMMKGFSADHRGCKPRWSPPAPRDVSEWAEGDDTGTSSRVIAATLSGHPCRWASTTPPQDPDDFGRCIRLLRLPFAVAADWTGRFDYVAKCYPEWAGIVAAWPMLVALYDEEAPSGKAAKLAAAMRSALGQP